MARLSLPLLLSALGAACASPLPQPPAKVRLAPLVARTSPAPPIDLVAKDTTRPEPWLAQALVDELRRRRVSVRDATSMAPDGTRLILRVEITSRNGDEVLESRRPSSEDPPSRVDEAEGPARTGFPDPLDPQQQRPAHERAPRSVEDVRLRINASLWRPGATAAVATSTFDEGTLGVTSAQLGQHAREWKSVYGSAAVRIADWALASVPP